MSYMTDDFSESLERTPIAATEVERVVAAWGRGDGMGHDAGHYRWSEAGATDWRGGFLLLLRDGTYAYVTGWCDYTGWGCQDGVEVQRFDTKPDIASLTSEDIPAPGLVDWDLDPADLNRWLKVSAEPPQ